MAFSRPHRDEHTGEPRQTTGRQQNMQGAQRYNAVAHRHQHLTPCLCDTLICALLLSPVGFIGACDRPPTTPGTIFFCCLLTVDGFDRVHQHGYCCSCVLQTGLLLYVRTYRISVRCCLLFALSCTQPRDVHQVDNRKHAQSTTLQRCRPQAPAGNTVREWHIHLGCTAVSSCFITACGP